MSLGTNIKSLRLFRGLSQRKLAEKLDKSVNTVANWEKDLSSPDLKTAKDICDVLNVTPNELLGYEVNQEYAEYIIELETSKDTPGQRILTAPDHRCPSHTRGGWCRGGTTAVLGTAPARDGMPTHFPVGSPTKRGLAGTVTLPAVRQGAAHHRGRVGRRKRLCYSALHPCRRTFRSYLYLWTQTHDDGCGQICQGQRH